MRRQKNYGPAWSCQADFLDVCQLVLMIIVNAMRIMYNIPSSVSGCYFFYFYRNGCYDDERKSDAKGVGTRFEMREVLTF